MTELGFVVYYTREQRGLCFMHGFVKAALGREVASVVVPEPLECPLCRQEADREVDRAKRFARERRE